MKSATKIIACTFISVLAIQESSAQSGGGWTTKTDQWGRKYDSYQYKPGNDNTKSKREAEKGTAAPERKYRDMTPSERAEMENARRSDEREADKREEARKLSDAAESKEHDPTQDEIKMNDRMNNEDYGGFFAIYNDPNTKFNEKTVSDGRTRIIDKLLFKLGELSKTDAGYVHGMYQISVEHKLGTQLPPFYAFYGYSSHTLYDVDYSLVKACIVMGKYDEAIERLRSNSFYGKKLNLKKSNDNYEVIKNLHNFVNYMAGRCFEALNQADSARYYLRRGEGFENEWTTLTDYGKKLKEKEGK